MNYVKQHSPVRQLLDLAQHVEFPAMRSEIMLIATGLNSKESLLDFLALFPADEIFNSRVDFMTRSEELEMLISQEKSVPVTVLHCH
jgi:hypothetical protein